MDEDVIEERGEYRVRLEIDQDCEDPRTYDDVVEIVTPLLRNRDIRTEGAEFQEAFNRLGTLFPRFMKIFHDTQVFEVYLYEHGNVALSVSSFVGRAQHAEWDSGHVGYAYVKPNKGWVDMDTEKVVADMVETLGEWINGDTYGYVVEKKEFWSKEYASPERADEEGWDWDEVESVWGYIGRDYAELNALDALGSFAGPVEAAS